MGSFILRRLIISFILLVAIVTIVFVMLRTLVPGDPSEIFVPDTAPPSVQEEIKKSLGLDKSIFEQYIIYMTNLAKGDMGRSFRDWRAVGPRIAQAMPVTLTLATLTTLMASTIGLAIGVLTAYKANSWIDNSLRVGSVLGASMPTFWVGLMLILIFSVYLGWLPVMGSMSLKGMILPVVTLGLGATAGLSRLTRASMLEVLSSDFIRTARGKGLGERSVVMSHAFRNALLPAITLIGLLIGGFLGGSVITESIFGLPGMGTLAITAIQTRDYPMIQGVVLVVSAIYLFVNLLVDITYGFVNPRIRYE